MDKKWATSDIFLLELFVTGSFCNKNSWPFVSSWKLLYTFSLPSSLSDSNSLRMRPSEFSHFEISSDSFVPSVFTCVVVLV